MTGRWQGSNRKATLPDDWPKLRLLALERDHHRCRWIEDGERCTAGATDVDHIDNPDDHRLTNLRSLCGPHHDRRSSQQGNAARWRHQRRRTPPTHPGLVQGG